MRTIFPSVVLAGNGYPSFTEIRVNVLRYYLHVCSSLHR